MCVLSQSKGHMVNEGNTLFYVGSVIVLRIDAVQLVIFPTQSTHAWIVCRRRVAPSRGIRARTGTDSRLFQGLGNATQMLVPLLFLGSTPISKPCCSASLLTIDRPSP